VQLYSKSPSALGVRGFLPANSLVAFSTNSMDLKLIIDYLIKQANLPPEALEKMAQTRAQVEEMLGINLDDDLLKRLESEAAFVLREIDLKAAYPLPSLALVWKTTDAAGLAETVAGVFERAAGMAPVETSIEKEEYRGVALTVARVEGLPTGEGVRPCFAVAGGYGLLCSSTVLAKEMIDLQASGGADLRAPQLIPGVSLPAQLNSVTLFRLGQILRIAGEIARNFRQLYDPEDQFFTARVKPALELLDVLGPIGGYSVFDGEGLLTTSRMRMQDLPPRPAQP
jgi:hypothetical protein